ncbi:Cysteine rich repeat-containing domain protein [Paragonimus heterotremus]|uniref:Cysteine rich repeat-containing domain protein n=1 Tax=Paragonimus heterotremus TaxID=100268 RepID=A0A8J4T452_9TREM|nr:Cysteine rich repeat-containing domain protein [Paragonimus heterotremus]
MATIEPSDLTDSTEPLYLIQWERAAPHLDPVLARACKADLMRNCGHQLNASTDIAVDRMDQSVRECLQTSLKNNMIYEEKCIDEIVQLIEEVKSDLHVDPVLHRACALEVQQICGEIEPGQGRQMTCLLRVLERSDAAHALGPACLTQLTKRRELWNHVAKLQRPDSLEELVYQVNASRSRNYILLALFIFFSFVFVFGLCCGRVTTRVPVDVKIK